MTQPVSFVVPVFNTGSALLDCVDAIAVAGATLPVHEVVLVDDASSDASTLSLLDALASRPGIIVETLPRNAGPSAARNAGARRARFDWLIFVDSDDRLTADSVTRRMAVAQTHPEAAWIAGDFDEEWQPGRLTRGGHFDGLVAASNPVEAGVYRLTRPLLAMVTAGCPPPLFTTMVRRDLFQAVGGLPSECRYAEDWYLSLSLACEADLYWLTDCLAVQRRYHESMMKNQHAMARHIHLAALRAFDDPRFGAVRRHLRWRVAADWRRSAAAFLACGEVAGAWRSVVQACRWGPTDRRSYDMLRRVLRASVPIRRT